MIHKRRRLFAKWRRTQCRHHRLAYNCLRNKIQRYIKDRKNQYNQFVLSKLDSLSTSRPNFWKTVKDLFGKRSYSNAPLIRGDTVHYDMTSKANIFNEYFTSISTAPDSIQSKILPRFHRCTDLFIPPLSIEPLDVYHVLLSLNPNKSKGFDNLPNRLLKNCAQSLATPFSLLFNFILATSHFPTAWKIASVIPLHKSGSLHDVKNYRPISILPSLSKVFEKLIHKHLYSYCETNNLLYDRNSGFRKYHSTTSNILEVTHKLLVAKDSGCSSRVVFLDISKAFDKVIHSALLFKLRPVGVTGSVYNLLQSYLSGRSQFVRLGNFRSNHLHTNCGVPQGSVLGPLLFLVYVNDIGTNINFSISLFADDTILLCSSKNPSALHTMLSNDLRQLEMWSDLWSVSFNAAKTEVRTITNNPSLHPPLRFCNQALNETTSHKHLGLIFIGL